MSMQSIRERYHVPAKRGMTVRNRYIDKQLGKIVSASKSYTRLYVRAENGVQYQLHPLELDYLVNDEWILGDDLTEKYNARIDTFNKMLNGE